MKGKSAISTLAVVVFLVLAMVAPAAALPDNPISMNARMIQFQEMPAVIHLGFEHSPLVAAGQPLLFGFEWGAVEGQTVSDLQAILEDPATSFTVSIDGAPPIDIVGFYQAAFYAETQEGPVWTWDHDGDGPGDGDGDGLDDWNGPIVFFRFPHPGLASGEHTFDFLTYWPAWGFFSDSITVTVVQ